MNEKTNKQRGGKLQLLGAEKWFGESQVVKGVDLNVDAGEFVVFVGPSGCGKSTLLRMIAGLEETSRGRIMLDGKDVTGEPPANRRLAMVFQSYALYPHLTVRENLGFSLKMAGVNAHEVATKVGDAARALRLDGLLERHPKMLSGGQRQRVAIGRAIVREPLAFLFDEPLSNLDAGLRVEMRFELAKLRESLRATMIYVTHDQVEAMTLADKIVVLRDGKIEQTGTPRELYEHPANRFVAEFIGSPKMNIIASPSSCMPGVKLPEGAAYLGVRAEHLQLAEENADADCEGIVELVEYLGSDTFVYANCAAAGMLTARLSANAKIKTATPIRFRITPAAAHYFDKNGNRCGR